MGHLPHELQFILFWVVIGLLVLLVLRVVLWALRRRQAKSSSITPSPEEPRFRHISEIELPIGKPDDFDFYTSQRTPLSENIDQTYLSQIATVEQDHEKIDPIYENQKTWDIVAHEFFDASALPVWGPFGIADDLHLISEIKDKTFLEIACGSGRSIKYLLDNDAAKVYGLDLSTTQLEEASRFNENYINENKVALFHGAMENKLDIETVDTVFSIYGVGWTQDAQETFKNIYSYLKPGGQFIWSWDHSFFSDVVYEDGKFVVDGSYHDEQPLVLPNWKKKHGVNAYLTYRKVSTWFQLLRDAGFQITAYYEPKPKTLDRGSEDPTKYYAMQKADKIPCSFIFVCTK